MYSAFADVQVHQLLTGTKNYQNGVIRCLPENQDTRDSGGMPSMVIKAQVTPPYLSRRTPI
jgi:hypothetical protein